MAQAYFCCGLMLLMLWLVTVVALGTAQSSGHLNIYNFFIFWFLLSLNSAVIFPWIDFLLENSWEICCTGIVNFAYELSFVLRSRRGNELPVWMGLFCQSTRPVMCASQFTGPETFSLCVYAWVFAVGKHAHWCMRVLFISLCEKMSHLTRDLQTQNQQCKCYQWPMCTGLILKTHQAHV